MTKARPKTWVINCTPEEDRTKQSPKDECDMNKIVARINKTGFVPLEAETALRRQIYGDASTAPVSLEDAYAIVQRAGDSFMSLPARLRERFVNPAGLLDFIEDPANLKEAQELGLLMKPAPMPLSGPNSGPSEPPANKEAALPKAGNTRAEVAQ